MKIATTIIQKFYVFNAM